MSLETTTIGELNSGAPLQGTDQFVIERVGGSNFKVTSDDISTFVGGGGGSPLTTKGDLFTFDTADARLPIGANDQVLTADSAEATGMKWADAAGGGGLRSIIASAIQGGTPTASLDVSFAAVPFDGTVSYIEVELNFSQSIPGPACTVNLNGETLDENFEFSFLVIDPNSVTVTADTQTFEDTINTQSGVADRWTHVRFRIYMGAGMGQIGPIGSWEETGEEGVGNEVYHRSGSWRHTNTDFQSTGITSIEINMQGGTFLENSSVTVYKVDSDLGPVTPVTPP